MSQKRRSRSEFTDLEELEALSMQGLEEDWVRTRR